MRTRQILNNDVGVQGLTTLASLVLVVIFGLIGWALIPNRSAVETQGFQLSLANETNLDVLTLKMASIGPDHYSLAVSTDPPNSQLTLILRFEPGVLPTCQGVNSGGWTCTLGLWPYGHTVSLTSMGAGSAQVVVPVTASAFTFSANGVTAQAWLPSVSCVSISVGASPSCENFGAAVISTQYVFPDLEGYSWNVGVPPAVSADTAVWERHPSQLSDAVSASATNPHAQQDDTYRVFFAGAAAGVAGAFFALSIQGGIQWLALRSRAKQMAAATTPPASQAT